MPKEEKDTHVKMSDVKMFEVEEEKFSGILKSLRALVAKHEADISAFEDLIDLIEDNDTIDVQSTEDLKTLRIGVKDLNFYKLDDIVNTFGSIVVERGTPVIPYVIVVKLTT